MKNADLNKGGFNWNSILDFCRKNIRYISAGIIVLILIIVLAVAAGNRNTKKEESDKQQEAVKDQEEQTEEFEVDAIQEINTLIENYYAAYATGDITTLESFATPVSDIEKGYIEVMSQYITGYENMKCYTKAGLAEGEYAVSVVMDMRFEGIDTTAPGLDFFYVRTKEDGAYYIDNLYSQFNLQNREQELDSKVEAFITEYEAQEDVAKLCGDVQNKYDKALAADENLKKMIEETIPTALEGWVAQVTGSTDQETADENTTPEEENQPADESTETVEEDQPTDSESTETSGEVQAASETVYATSNINIRKEPNESAEKAGSSVAGQSFTRTGTTEDGWSEIEYDGAKAYIKSDYVSTEAPAEGTDDGGLDYVPEGTVLTINSGLNVRASMSETAELMGTTAIGDQVTVVLSYQEGWTKVEWNGQTGYIKTELLLNN